MKRILFVNHRQKECGVQAMGSRYYRNLAESKKFDPYYIDVDKFEEYDYWYHVLKPAAVVWNFYSSATMPWFNPSCLLDRGTVKHLAIYHELPLESLGFDLILHQDPDPPIDNGFQSWALPRSIPVYQGISIEPDVPTFGSFGFGLGGKGFDDMVEQVCEEYDEANVHLHIPFAHFGDADGVGARAHAKNARKKVTKSGIKLTIDHDFWSEEELLHWLAGNTANCFFYHFHAGRGISGTTDYALAVKKPLVITNSWQFRHLWGVNDSFVFGVKGRTIKSIVSQGSAPTDQFRQMWSREAFVKSFEDAIESVLT